MGNGNKRTYGTAKLIDLSEVRGARADTIRDVIKWNKVKAKHARSEKDYERFTANVSALQMELMRLAAA